MAKNDYFRLYDFQLYDLFFNRKERKVLRKERKQINYEELENQFNPC